MQVIARVDFNASFVSHRRQFVICGFNPLPQKLIQSCSGREETVYKRLEDANVKLSSVASDTFGVTPARCQAIISGNVDPVSLADLAVGRLKGKKENSRACRAFSQSSWFYDSASWINWVMEKDHCQTGSANQREAERLSSWKGVAGEHSRRERNKDRPWS